MLNVVLLVLNICRLALFSDDDADGGSIRSLAFEFEIYARLSFIISDECTHFLRGVQRTLSSQ